MKPYVLDITKNLREYEDSVCEAEKNYPAIVEMFPYLYKRKLALGDEHTNNIDYKSLEIGHGIYVWDSNINGMFLCEVTMLYHTVMFFKWLEGPNKGKEDYYDKGCLLFQHWIFPMKVKSLQGWEISSNCKRVEFIY